MNNFTNHIFFISAERHDRPSMVNRVNSLELFNSLKREFNSVIQVKGCYNGVTEGSFMVTVNFDEVSRATSILKALANLYNQECIAYVDNERVLTLLFSNDNTVRLGVLKQAPNATDNFTELNGVKYATE